MRVNLRESRDRSYCSILVRQKTQESIEKQAIPQKIP